MSHSEYCFSLHVQMSWYSHCGRGHIQMQLIMYYRRITEEHCELNAINVENKTILKKGKNISL